MVAVFSADKLLIVFVVLSDVDVADVALEEPSKLFPGTVGAMDNGLVAIGADADSVGKAVGLLRVNRLRINVVSLAIVFTTFTTNITNIPVPNSH